MARRQRRHPKNMMDEIQVGGLRLTRWQWETLVNELRPDGMLVGFVREALADERSTEERDAWLAEMTERADAAMQIRIARGDYDV